MTYQFITTPHEITIQRVASSGNRIITLVAGLVSTAAGAYVASLADDDLFLVILGCCFVVLGLMTALLGTWARHEAALTTVDRFTFNLRHHRLDVYLTARKKHGSIPYTDMAGFDLAAVRSLEKRGSSSSTVVTHYLLSVVKKDGGVWVIMDTQDEALAHKILSQLKEKVDLTGTATGVPSSSFDTLEHNQTAEGPQLRWRNNTGIAGPFFLLVLIGCFGLLPLALLTDSTASPGQQVVGWLLAVVVMSVFLLVALFLLREAWLRHTLLLGQHELSYTQSLPLVGSVGRPRVLPLQGITAIVYAYSEAAVSRLPGTLLLLTEPEAQKLRDRKRELHKPIADVFWENQKPLALHVHGLDPVEGLALERWLQEQIRQRTGQSIA